MLSAGLLRAQGVPPVAQLKILCAIDGTREPFHVDINDSDHSDIQEKIKLEQPMRSISGGQRPLSGLVWKEDTVQKLSCPWCKRLQTLRQRPELCFFDKSAFIWPSSPSTSQFLSSFAPQVGKSLGLSTLHTSMVVNTSDYKPLFEVSGLAIDEHVKKERDSAAASLTAGVNVVHDLLAILRPLSMIKGIYYLVPIDSVQWKPPRRVYADNVLKGFWASVKSRLGNRKITKCYITGVSPQSLVDSMSGFNVAQDPELASFCGLTEADVAAALALKKVYMRDHYNGFNFVPGGQGPLIYNTDTCSSTCR
ncbi:MAG: hypothetical protein BYD32DRAFT_418469 [Podila humilis]|nr:MAG: hypothetical protein BYD32DRAFT_418469 [Podila humilis]